MSVRGYYPGTTRVIVKGRVKDCTDSESDRFRIENGVPLWVPIKIRFHLDTEGGRNTGWWARATWDEEEERRRDR